MTSVCAWLLERDLGQSSGSQSPWSSKWLFLREAEAPQTVIGSVRSFNPGVPVLVFDCTQTDLPISVETSDAS